MLASARSAGKTFDYLGKTYTIEELTDDSFDGVDIALFSAGGAASKRFAPVAAKAGAVVIDNSSAFRMDPHRPARRPGGQPRSDRHAPRHHRQPQLLDDHHERARLAAASSGRGEAHRRLDVSSGERRRRGGDGRARTASPRLGKRRPAHAGHLRPPVHLEPLQPQLGHRPRHGLQHRRDQDDQGDREDLRLGRHPRRRHVRPRPRPPRPLRVDQPDVREAAERRRRPRHPRSRAGCDGPRRPRQQQAPPNPSTPPARTMSTSVASEPTPPKTRATASSSSSPATRSAKAPPSTRSRSRSCCWRRSRCKPTPYQRSPQTSRITSYIRGSCSFNSARTNG